MLLTITTTHEPATDLGYLLHKHPERTQSFDLSFGQAHVFYPEAAADRCTAAILLDVDPVGLVRSRASATLDHYVSDRPYVASSFMSVAISQVMGSALGGRCKDKPTLAQTAIPLRLHVAVVRCRAGEDLIREFFEPLGYSVDVQSYPLDPEFPQWGESPYYALSLQGTVTLSSALRHLYVLLPAMDDRKHYWVGEDEIDKLMAKGGDWLADHPKRDLITRRYLRHRRHLTRVALERLMDEEETEDERADPEAAVEKPIRLHDQRLGAVLAALKDFGASRVLDLGCGEGQLLRRLMREKQFVEIVGMDVSTHALERASRRLRLDRLPERQREKIQLLQGSLVYRDSRLAGFDAAAVVEVIEHLDPPRLRAFERVLFEAARPRVVALTTPNREFNVRFETLAEGSFRHPDHRFEWTREEFAGWCERISNEFGYGWRILGIGEPDPDVGAPSQMALFERTPPLDPEVS